MRKQIQSSTTMPAIGIARIALLTAVVAAGTWGAHTAEAAVYWDGTGTSWSAASSWSTSSGTDTPDPAAAPGAGDDVVFNTSAVNTAQSVSLGGTVQAANSLTFNSTGAVNVLSGGTATTFTLGTGGITINSGAGAVTVGSSGTGNGVGITLNGSQKWTNNSANTFSISNTVNGTTGGADLGAGNNSLTIAGSGNTTFATPGATNVNNIRGGANTSLIKEGSGSLTLGGNNNNFLGSTTINGGTIQLNHAGSLGGSNAGVVTVNVNNGLTFGNGITAATVGGLAGTGNIVLANTDSNAVTLNFGSKASSYSGTLSGAGSIGMGSGNVTLSGANTYTGTTNITNGGGILTVSSINSVLTNATLGTVHSTSSSLGAPTDVASGTIGLGISGNGGTLKYIGTGEITDRVIRISGNAGSTTIDQSGTGLLKFVSTFTYNVTTAGTKTLTLTGTGAGEIAGGITDSDLANGKLIGINKTGTGTWALSGTNTYTGATTIGGGTLQMGSSSLGGTITVNNTGTLAIGSSTGTGILTVNNNVLLNNNSNLTVKLNGSAAGTGYDQIVLTGAASTLSLTGTNNLNLTVGFAPVQDSLMFLADIEGSNAISGVFEKLNGVTTTLTQDSLFSLGGTTYKIGYTGDADGGTFTGGNDLVLQVISSPVPEPAALSILATMGLVICLRKNRL